jgi:polysaccharide biosynthesis/export protein
MADMVGRAVFVLLWCAFGALSCAAERPFVWYSTLPAPQKLAARATIGPGDRILVQVTDHPELSGEFVVGMSGEYSHPIAGLIRVDGSDAIKAAEVVRIKLSRFVQDPAVAVTLISYDKVGITVMGEVRTPGAFQLEHGAGVMAALGAAGGLNDFASEDGIYVLRAEHTGQRIRFRYSDLTKPDPAAVNFELHEGDALVVE